MRVTCGCPQGVEVRQRDVHDGVQRFGVTHGGDAADGFCNSWGPREAHAVGCRSTINFVKETAAVKHWPSARELVGSEPPTPDDLPTTLAGEPLDSATKIREFLASLDRARTA